MNPPSMVKPMSPMATMIISGEAKAWKPHMSTAASPSQAMMMCFNPNRSARYPSEIIPRKALRFSTTLA